MRLMDLFTNDVTFSSEIFLPFVGKGMLAGVLGDVEGVDGEWGIQLAASILGWSR